jgi:hypothetical protein
VIRRNAERLLGIVNGIVAESQIDTGCADR